jgi:hypothetical protein
MTDPPSAHQLESVVGLVARAAHGSAPDPRDLELTCRLALEDGVDPGSCIAREALLAAATRLRRLHREGFDVSPMADALVRGCGRNFDLLLNRDREGAEVLRLCSEVADAAWHGSMPPRTPLVAAIEGMRTAVAGDRAPLPPDGAGLALAPTALGGHPGNTRAILRRHPHGTPDS